MRNPPAQLGSELAEWIESTVGKVSDEGSGGTQRQVVRGNVIRRATFATDRLTGNSVMGHLRGVQPPAPGTNSMVGVLKSSLGLFFQASTEGSISKH